jgi:hypothetical protein
MVRTTLLAEAKSFAVLLRRAGTPPDNAGPRIQERYGLTDAELRSLMTAVWGREVKPNQLLSKPPVGYHRLQNTARFRRLLGRQPTDADYEGVHTTSSEAIAGAYAMGTWDHQQRQGYPVIITLDVSGLEPLPDVDAMLQGAESVDALLATYRREAENGADFYSLLNDDDYSEPDARAGDAPAAFIFEDTGAHPLSSIENYAQANDLDPEEVFAQFLKSGELPPEVLSDMVQQQRYLNDFDIDRIVRIEAIKPWWDSVMVSWEDEEVEELAEAGWFVFVLDDYPFSDAGETKVVWEAPDAKKRTDVEFHGTTSLVVDRAFPGLIPEESPFQVRDAEDE